MYVCVRGGGEIRRGRGGLIKGKKKAEKCVGVGREGGGGGRGGGAMMR